MYIETEARPQGEVKELDDASKLLLKAAAVIEDRGWCQWSYESLDGRVCLLGALKVAAGGSPNDDEDEDSVVGIAKRAMAGAVGKVFVHSWNDHPNRTKEEVVAKLRAVALGGQ